jgi:sugar/nucleoside kinase (ribokinase family)
MSSIPDSTGSDRRNGIVSTPIPDLIVIGDVMLDVTVSSGVLVRGGDVHGEVRIDPAGSAANVAVWAAEAGASVRLLGCVGDDAAGGVVRETLRRRGVAAELAVAPGIATGAMLVLTEDGERSMVASRGANSRLAAMPLPDVLEGGAVFLSGYTLLDRDTEGAAVAALTRARAPIVAVDAGSWPLIARRGAAWFFDATRKATMVCANAREAEALTGVRDEAAARSLATRYAMAAVKLGARGALLAQGGTVIHVPAPVVREVDATGAGDAFDGALLAALVRGARPRDALARACAAGARCAAQAGRWPPAGGPRQQ